MAKGERVRVLLISPAGRLLLIKYRNTQRSGAALPCWITAGGGCDEGETLEETALREIREETGIAGVRLGPVVWYGEDSQRSGDLGAVYKEHFIVAFAPSETLESSGWTEHEKTQILETRWWTPAAIRASGEAIYPVGLADLLEPILDGIFPSTPVILPPI